MNVARSDHLAVRMADGRVLVVGGNAGNYMRDGEVYNPKTRRWTRTHSLNQPRLNWAAPILVALPSGGALLIGGSADTTTYAPLRTIERLNPVTLRWTRVGSLQRAREGATATVLRDGRVLIAGGRGDPGAQVTTEFFNPKTNKTSLGAAMPVAREGGTATLLADGSVLLAAGTSPFDLEISTPYCPLPQASALRFIPGH
jgi:hypothetical protein